MNRTLMSAYEGALWATLGLSALAVALPGGGVAVAQPAAPPAAGYGGVTPGSDHLPEGFTATPGSAPLVTWPGFQPLPDGGARVFVQTNVAVTPELQQKGGRVVVLIPGVSLPRGNARLPLDTHFFKTPVQSVRIKPEGRGVAITIMVQGKATPKLRTERAKNGFFFTYVEFAPER